MSGDEPVPASPTSALHTRAPREPIVELELDRRAVLIDGLETHTCIQCGEHPASHVGPMLAPGRFRRVVLQVCLCDRCQEENAAAFRRVGGLARAVNGLYVAQLVAFGAGLAGVGGGAVLPLVTALFLGTWGGSYIARRRLLREQPRLLEVKGTTVRLQVPRAWAQVLADENPRAIVRGPA